MGWLEMDTSLPRINLVSLFATSDDLADFCMLDNGAQTALLAELLAEGVGTENLICNVDPTE